MGAVLVSCACSAEQADVAPEVHEEKHVVSWDGTQALWLELRRYQGGELVPVTEADASPHATDIFMCVYEIPQRHDDSASGDETDDRPIVNLTNAPSYLRSVSAKPLFPNYFPVSAVSRQLDPHGRRLVAAGLFGVLLGGALGLVGKTAVSVLGMAIFGGIGGTLLMSAATDNVPATHGTQNLRILPGQFNRFVTNLERLAGEHSGAALEDFPCLGF